MSGKRKWYLISIIVMVFVLLWCVGGFCDDSDEWYEFLDNGIIDNDEFNVLFDHLTGDFYPRSIEGTRESGTYSLGSSSWRWYDLYLSHDADFDGILTTAGITADSTTSTNITSANINATNIGVASAEIGVISGTLTGEPISFMFELQSTAFTAEAIDKVYVVSSFQITNVQAYADTAPTGKSIIIDVNKDGTTIFTDQNNRPTILIGLNTATIEVPAVLTIEAGSRLSWDIDQVGTTEAGGNFLMLSIKAKTL